MTVITTADLTWDANWGRYVYNVTTDHAVLTLQNYSLDNILINGNNFDVGQLNLGADNDGMIVRDLDVNGTSVSDNVTGSGCDSLQLVDLRVSGGNHNGIRVSGDDISLNRVTVHDIGGPALARAFAINLDGSDCRVAYSYVYDIHGTTESVGVSFESGSGTGNQVYNSTIDGSAFTAWSFGIWSSGPGSVSADNVYLHDVVQAVGAGGGVDFTHGTIEDVAWLGQVTDLTGSYVINELGQQSTDFNGGSSTDWFVGDGTDQTLEGGVGQDVMYGFGGADTFIFRDIPGAGQQDIIVDAFSDDTFAFDDSVFATDNVQLGTYALGSGPTFYYDYYAETLNYDIDGVGGASGTVVAYMPGSDPFQLPDVILI